MSQPSGEKFLQWGCVGKAHVRQVNMQVMRKYRRLCIAHTRSELVIYESCMPDPSAFDALCRAFAERMAIVNKPLA